MRFIYGVERRREIEAVGPTETVAVVSGILENEDAS